ncbi:MAG: anti-sigma factor [Chloroflexi bacterium]|nr:anti-sigma factor [Chloroflexota bacterium]
MAQNNLSNEPHPDDLLGSYALDALDHVEEAQVEAHLDGCLLCRQTVSRLLQVATQLGQSVSPSTPSPQLQSRIMEAVRRERGQSVPAAAPAHSIRSGFGFGRRISRVLVPVAGVLLLILGLSLVYNVSLTRQVERLEMESVSVSARLFNFSTENAQLLDALRQQEVSSYLMANPASQPMLLESPQGAGDSQGVLLVSDDGRHAILMVAGMPPGPGYQVWLLRSGEKIPMGQVEVDSTGWGAKNLYLPEPLFRFDKVELRPTAADGDSEPSKILEGKISSMRRSK